MHIDKIVPIEGQPGMIYAWSHSTGWPIQESDLEAFKAHMDDWYSILRQGPLTRSNYETACQLRGITPTPDDQIGTYGDTYGDFGMSHYHTVPENRQTGIEATLNQKRWQGMLQENPAIGQQRREAECIRQEERRIEALRKTYSQDLDAWITAIGGLDSIYQGALELHANNSHVLREEGRHFEWLIGHTCHQLSYKASEKCPGYVAGARENDWTGNYPLRPEWWAGWSETDPLHPINRIAEMLKDKRIEPYTGKVTYYGYGEDCGDDVRQNAKEWL